MQGYWGDIVCSPYFAIGIDSDVPNKYAEGLYEIMNKVRARVMFVGSCRHVCMSYLSFG